MIEVTGNNKDSIRVGELLFVDGSKQEAEGRANVSIRWDVNSYHNDHCKLPWEIKRSARDCQNLYIRGTVCINDPAVTTPLVMHIVMVVGRAVAL